MLSAAKIKLIRSLSRKKCRKEEGLFLAEGPKVVGELSGHFECALLAGTEKWFARQRDSVCQALESFTITEQELCRASLLQMQKVGIESYIVHEPQGGHGMGMYSEENLKKMTDFLDSVRTRK